MESNKTTSATQYNSQSTSATVSSSPKTFHTATSTSSLQSSNAIDESLLLPTNICTYEQLEQLPIECIANNPLRPIQHVNEDGITITTYSLNPMIYSVGFILLVEVLERFSYYSLNATLTSYLTGQYNSEWNANINSIIASSYVSVSIAIAYTSPFIGAILGDRILGEYYTILFGSIIFYIPGLLCVAITTIPHFLNTISFNHTLLRIGILFLWPIGTGIVKSVVNIFGAKQFHPLLQSSLIESYYVNFYMCINIGALLGGITVPTLASQYSVTVAYFLPVTMLCIAVLFFTFGTSRYVITQPKHHYFSNIYTNRKKKMKKIGSNDFLISAKKKISSSSNTQSIQVNQLFRLLVLIVPFCIAYSQMPTTFIIQGTVMKKAFGGYVDAAIMYNNDTLSVLIFGYIIGSYLYPYLSSKNIKIPTTYKFAIGSGFGTLAIGWALYVDHLIHKTYNENGEMVSILYQAMSYILIGIGEIFAISSAYEVAFKASPPESKVLSSALNIFCIGGIPNVICIGLYQLCSKWFINTNDGTSNISHIEDYATAHVYKYFWVLFFISLFGVIINILPPVRQYVESIENKSIDLLKTPKTPMIRRIQQRMNDNDDIENNDDEERQALLLLQQQQRHEYYLKYGSDRTLHHANSMRAGPFIKDNNNNNTTTTSSTTKADQHSRMKKTTISTLYGNSVTSVKANNNDHNNETTPLTAPNVNNNFVSINGKPVSEWKPKQQRS